MFSTSRDNPAIKSFADCPDLMPEADRIGGAAWPEFMLHDPVAMENWGRLIDYFADCQLMVLDGEQIVALANAVPLHLVRALSDLPDRGVEWGVEQSLTDHANGLPANTLMGVQVVVPEAHKGKGLSRIATRAMLDLAKRKGISQVIIPVRPSDKHRFPLIPMEDYIMWQREDGLPFDGWLRVHARLGGEVLNICSHSMRIPGTVAEWTEWTGNAFPGSGAYLVDGALGPITIDIKADTGLYLEPNVWISHTIDLSEAK